LKRILLFLCAGLFTLLISTSAMAIGVGAYVDMGVGNTAYGSGTGSGGTDLTPTGGLILDLAAAKNKIFNYRLKIGGGRMFSNGLKLDKIGIVNTFGLSPINLRGDEARFFFGPRIVIHYVGGEITVKNNSFSLFGSSTKSRMDYFRFDLGVVFLGFNFNLGDAATVTFEFGMDYGIMAGNSNGSTITANGYEGFATMGFMYRINDSFSDKPSANEPKLIIQ
jgi:hypothetical protein